MCSQSLDGGSRRTGQLQRFVPIPAPSNILPPKGLLFLVPDVWVALRRKPKATDAKHFGRRFQQLVVGPEGSGCLGTTTVPSTLRLPSIFQSSHIFYLSIAVARKFDLPWNEFASYHRESLCQEDREPVIWVRCEAEQTKIRTRPAHSGSRLARKTSTQKFLSHKANLGPTGVPPACEDKERSPDKTLIRNEQYSKRERLRRGLQDYPNARYSRRRTKMSCFMATTDETLPLRHARFGPARRCPGLLSQAGTMLRPGVPAGAADANAG